MYICIYVYMYICMYVGSGSCQSTGLVKPPPPFHRALRDHRELPGLQERPGLHQHQALRVLVELQDLLAQVR